MLGLEGGVYVGSSKTILPPPPRVPPLGALLRQFAVLLFRKFDNCLIEHCDHRVAPSPHGDMSEPPKPKEQPPRQDSAPLSPS